MCSKKHSDIPPRRGDTGGGGASTGGTTTGGDGTTGGTTSLGPTGTVQFGTLYYYPSYPSVESIASAWFRSPSASAEPGDCVARFRACSVSTCNDSSGTTTNSVPASAGDITFTASPEGFQAVLSPDATKSYGTTSLSGYLGGEETVTIVATGADVPAFETTMTYPLLLLLTSPDASATEGVATASRTDDLVLEWDRGAPGKTFLVQTQNTNPSDAFLNCSVPSETGVLAIPAAALAYLAPSTELLLLTMNLTHVTAGSYDVSVMGFGAVMIPDRTRRASIVVE